MTCSSCDDLRRQLREARDEIAAWEANDRDAGRVEVSEERLGRWRQRLRTPPAVCLTLMLLVDREGRLQSKAAVIAATRAGPGLERDREPVDHLAGVYICHARKALRRLLGHIEIETIWGQGWVLQPDMARRLRVLMGEAA